MKIGKFLPGPLRKAIARTWRRAGTAWMSSSAKGPSRALLHGLFFGQRLAREQRAILAGKARYQVTHGTYGDSCTTLRRNVHRLEKGLIMRPQRDVFALAYIEETIAAYKRAVEETKGEASEEICWARDVLRAYFDACGPDELIDHLREEYQKIPGLPARCRADRADLYRPYARNLKEPIPVEYASLHKLAERRRSVRWFLQKPVPRELIEQAVLVAGLSPSACNRQPFEFRFFDDPILIPKVASLPGGTVGFHENFPVIGVVLGSLAHYYDEKDRHLIYIDGGLATMSLVYALESLGLSSCCINWPDIEEDEVRAGKMLGLKPYERPVMFLAIGYPDPEGLVPYSQKKPVSQLCRWNYIG